LETAPETLLTEERKGQRRRLMRVLGVGFGLAVTIGNTIGAGILRTPGEVAAHLPNLWLFLGVWVLGGMYALLGALNLAELGTAIPRSGGQYVFAHRALGPYAGFVVGWSDWLSTCGATASVSLVVGEYAGALFPALAGRTITIALAVSGIFAVLQWRGVRWGSSAQNLTSMLKALGFVALVVACFALGGEGLSSNAQTHRVVPTGLPLMTALVLALQSVIYTYDGWSGVVYFSEEVRQPARDIPRSLFFGVLSIIAIYLLVNVALVYVLPLSGIAGDDLAIGAAAQKIFGGYGGPVIRVLTIISMLSAINAFHLMATRVLFSMSCDRLCSSRAERVNTGGTPSVALFMSALVAVLFIVSATFQKVIAILAFFFVANYTISFASVFVLRWREPELKRPYRVWGYPWTTGLALLCSIVFLCGAVASDTINSLYALLLLAASYPAYLLLRRLSRDER
jgi:APA family basic amino acid/polyamine antiporter